MPRLFDLLSEHSDKEKLRHLQQQAQEQRKKQHSTSHPPAHDPKNKFRGDKQQAQQKNEKPSFHKNPREQFRNSHKAHSQVPNEVTIHVPNFVAIDVETTGLEIKRDRIIEIGAVKYINGQQTDQFSTLINPCCQIPQAVSDLTGIQTELVESAPTFDRIADSFCAFIGSLPLCGHQIHFDFSFVNTELKRANKQNLDCLTLDSAALSRLLLDDLPGYSLAQVCEYLSLDLKRAHRALDDAKASGEIACKLVPILGEIPFATRKILGRWAPYSVLKDLLINSVRQSTMVRFTPHTQKITVSIPNLLQKEPQLTLAQLPIQEFLQNNCQTATDIQQKCETNKKITEKTFQALEHSNIHLFAVDSTRDRVVPFLGSACVWAIKNGTRVFIVGNSQTFWKQVIQISLPELERFFPGQLRWTVLKPATNYLCKQRWEHFLSGEFGFISNQERLGILPLLKWGCQTKTGDIDEQNQFNKHWFHRIWSLISIQEGVCQHSRCNYHTECFYVRSRLLSQRSHVVLVPQTLLYVDHQNSDSLIDEGGALICDDAHALYQSGLRCLRTEIDSQRLQRFSELVSALISGFEKRAVCTNKDLAELKVITKNFKRDAELFQTELIEWVQSKVIHLTGETKNDFFSLQYTPRELPAFSGLSGCKLCLSELYEHITRVMNTLSSYKNEFIYNESKNCILKIMQLKQDILFLMQSDASEYSFWVEGDSSKGWIKCAATTKTPYTHLYPLWNRKKGATILISSAPVSVPGAVNHIRSICGLGSKEVNTEFFQMQAESNTYPLFFLRQQSSANNYHMLVENILSITQKVPYNCLVLSPHIPTAEKIYTLVRQSTQFDPKIQLFGKSIPHTRPLPPVASNAQNRSLCIASLAAFESIDIAAFQFSVVFLLHSPEEVPMHPLSKDVEDWFYQNQHVSYHMFESIVTYRRVLDLLITDVTKPSLVLMNVQPGERELNDYCGFKWRMFDTSDELATQLMIHRS